ncbi:MAG TPA: DUF899 family protein [Polyangiaceae bacterium]|nr:DUF899 family protein [Polyangiaceae bacterium]
MNAHEVVGAAEWVNARKTLLEKEKAFTKAREALAVARRALPWERVEKRYLFDGPGGEETLSDLPGMSVFYRDESGGVFHTYSTFARGLDMMNTAYQILDLVPKGRDEAGLSQNMSWVRRRDEYGNQE